MSTTTLMSSASDLVSDTLVVGKATFSSRSGRAILAAQVGQGALLYSISSWGPLYLELVGASAAAASGTASGQGGGSLPGYQRCAGGEKATLSVGASDLVPRLRHQVGQVGAVEAATAQTKRATQGGAGRHTRRDPAMAELSTAPRWPPTRRRLRRAAAVAAWCGAARRGSEEGAVGRGARGALSAEWILASSH